MMIALGMFFDGLIDSPLMQHISSKPMYPKNEDVAPLRTPPAPNSFGMNGIIFSFFTNVRLNVAMKNTSETFNVEKKLVTLLDSFTPPRSKRTAPNDTKKAHGLIPKPGSNMKMRYWYHALGDSYVLAYVTTLSPQLLATADALCLFAFHYLLFQHVVISWFLF